MANLGAVLKDEIARIARSEIRAAVEPLRKSNAAHKREIVELKRQIGTLKKELGAVSRPSSATSAATASDSGKVRFVAKGVKSLRARLGLSAADFGRLVGASGQSIYNWETGKAIPREPQVRALAAVRGLGKREAARRLQSKP